MTENQFEKFMIIADTLIKRHPIDTSYKILSEKCGVKSKGSMYAMAKKLEGLGLLNCDDRKVTLTKKGETLYRVKK